jgi:hypothetical protein
MSIFGLAFFLVAVGRIGQDQTASSSSSGMEITQMVPLQWTSYTQKASILGRAGVGQLHFQTALK